MIFIFGKLRRTFCELVTVRHAPRKLRFPICGNLKRQLLSKYYNKHLKKFWTYFTFKQKRCKYVFCNYHVTLKQPLNTDSRNKLIKERNKLKSNKKQTSTKKSKIKQRKRKLFCRKKEYRNTPPSGHITITLYASRINVDTTSCCCIDVAFGYSVPHKQTWHPTSLSQSKFSPCKPPLSQQRELRLYSHFKSL